MTLAHFMCRHCGAWHEYFASPPTCFVCSDVRNALPPEGFVFDRESDLRERVKQGEITTSWRYVEDDIVVFTNAPSLGIGSSGYVILRPEGNVGFEATAWYTDEALAFLDSIGGLTSLSSSHPHGMGALWQLQRRFDPEVVMHRDAVRFTKAFDVDFTFDDTLSLAGGISLHHIGGHYEGHAVLHDRRRRALFCGDAIKFEWDNEGLMMGLSCHKAFHKRIPLSHGEVRRYLDVIGALDFAQVFSTFEHGPGVTTADVVRFYTDLLSRPRTTSSTVRFAEPRRS